MSSQPELEICPVCGIRMKQGQLYYPPSHIYGPVTETTTGKQYPGHPVRPGEPHSTSDSPKGD